MIYLVTYLLVGSALLLLTAEEFFNATEHSEMNRPERVLTGIVAVALWPLFVLATLVGIWREKHK